MTSRSLQATVKKQEQNWASATRFGYDNQGNTGCRDF